MCVFFLLKSPPLFLICGNADIHFYCMKIILDSINIEKCIYFEKNNLLADLKSIFWVKMVDRSPYFMQALSPLIINKQKICSDEFPPYTIISCPIWVKHKTNSWWRSYPCTKHCGGDIVMLLWFHPCVHPSIRAFHLVNTIGTKPSCSSLSRICFIWKYFSRMSYTWTTLRQEWEKWPFITFREEWSNPNFYDFAVVHC